MVGTIRTLDRDMKEHIRNRMNELVSGIAKAYRATVEVIIEDGTDITYNYPELTQMMLPTLQKVAGMDKVTEISAITGAEDFSYFQKEVPGLFFFLGGTPTSLEEADAPSHHTPDFFVDDSSMLLGVKTLSQLALDYLAKE